MSSRHVHRLVFDIQSNSAYTISPATCSTIHTYRSPSKTGKKLHLPIPCLSQGTLYKACLKTLICFNELSYRRCLAISDLLLTSCVWRVSRSTLAAIVTPHVQ